MTDLSSNAPGSTFVDDVEVGATQRVTCVNKVAATWSDGIGKASVTVEFDSSWETQFYKSGETFDINDIILFYLNIAVFNKWDSTENEVTRNVFCSQESKEHQ